MPDPYLPNLVDFCDILRDYSRHGLSYFKDLPDATQRSIRAKLAGGLEDNEFEIERKLASIKKGTGAELKFLPMPRPGGRDFKASFFSPRFRLNHDQSYACSFVIVFWVERDGGRTLAVRLEPPMRLEPEAENLDAHRYTHLQMTPTIISPNIKTDLADWIPKSYPAFPLGYTHPIQFFVCMAAAVHGYSANTKREYVRLAIAESMATGNAALLAQKILAELRRMLG